MMRKVTAFLLILIPLVGFSQLIPDFYLNYDEIMDSLGTLEALYPDRMDIFQIGTTTFDSLPIYAVKISNNVHENRDKPRLLFVGQVHAEEIDMTQLPLNFCSQLVQNGGSPWSTYRNATEIYVVPSANPEGMNVVMDELDIYYRKNKRDNVGDGLFRFTPPPVLGYDSSGVDPSRNFDFNWIHGDTLWSIGHTERYDYYRGPYPFSEGMAIAIKDLAEEKHFCLSIIFHQSRSTNFSEKVIHAWNWRENGIDTDKLAPDDDVLTYIGNELANKIAKLGSPGFYERNYSSSKYGNSHDWFYAKMGCYQYTVETSGIQLAVQSNLNTVINNNIDGIKYLIERAIGYPFTTGNMAQLTGIVTDSVTGYSLYAEVKIVGRESGLFAPRMTIPEFGRYRFILNSGSHTLQVSKPGYQTYTATFGIGSSSPSIHNVALQPLPYYEVSGSVLEFETLNPIDGTIYFAGNMQDTVQIIDGSFSVSLPESEYEIRIDADGYVSRFDTINVNSVYQVDYILSPVDYVYDEDFESGLGEWETGGDYSWNTDASESHSGMYSAADSPSSDYVNSTFGYIQKTFDLSDYAAAHLSFWHKYYLEPEYDFGYVSVSIDNGTDWTDLAEFDLQDVDWGKEYLDLTPFCGDQVIVRFALSTDENLVEPGWNIDDISVAAAETLVHADDPENIPDKFYVDNPYPNPFNSSTSIRFSLDKPSSVKVKIFDVSGRLVVTLLDKELPAGLNSLKWDAKNTSSGIFFMRFETENHQLVKKILLLK